MNILLIAPDTYKYSFDIANSLREKGHIVTLLKDYTKSNLGRITHHISLSLFCKIQNRFFERQINKMDFEIQYDTIFIIRGYCFRKKTILLLRNKYPNAKLYLYQWDPLSISLFDPLALDLFDKCYSFDINDVKKYRELSYKTLFYIPAYNDCETNKVNNQINDIDVSFIGTNHTDRINILYNLIPAIQKNAKTIYIKLCFSKLRFYFLKVINWSLYKNINEDWISFHQIPRKQAQDIFNRSKVVIDIHHPSQNGLSIRVIEVLSKGKKLITTNANIMNEPFYNPNTICVIDRSNIEIEDSFWSNQHYNTFNMDGYSLDNWLKSIIDNL